MFLRDNQAKIGMVGNYVIALLYFFYIAIIITFARACAYAEKYGWLAKSRSRDYALYTYILYGN